VITANPLESFESYDFYCSHFTDLDLWRPNVIETCTRHFQIQGNVRTGIPGTYPTFIVDDQYVVKFFGLLFEGHQAFETEREANRLLERYPSIPVPKVLASGTLLDSPPYWPYLIFTYLPGFSIAEVEERLSVEEKLFTASELGKSIRILHSIPLPVSGHFQASISSFRDLLFKLASNCCLNHRSWNSLPDKLVEEIDGYLLPVEKLIDPVSNPHLIHADLTLDHLLGRFETNSWVPLGIIDWGDAMIGNILYELVALHLDLFKGDKHLLEVFLEAYKLPSFYQEAFAQKAMTMTLLHRFDVLAAPWLSYVSEARSLDDLADQLWGI